VEMNTRIISHEFEYFAPNSIQETLTLLDQHGSEAKIIAGGTDLVSQMKMGKRTPAYIIDIKRIKELQYIAGDMVLKIGAGNNLRGVMNFFLPASVPYAGLYEAIRSIGKTQVLNMATIGGNLCNGSPKADTAPPLLTYDARIKLVSLKGERILALKDFHSGPNRTIMEANELMTEIQLDKLPKGTSSAFEKKARVGADISKITCAVTVVRDGDVCRSCRIALGAAAPVPMRAFQAESMLTGKIMNDALTEETSQQVAQEINPPTVGRTHPEYRRHLAAVMFKDGFRRAWQQAGGGK